MFKIPIEEFNKSKQQISFRLEKNTLDKLKCYSDNQGVTQTSVVEKILTEFFKDRLVERKSFYLDRPLTMFLPTDYETETFFIDEKVGVLQHQIINNDLLRFVRTTSKSTIKPYDNAEDRAEIKSMEGRRFIESNRSMESSLERYSFSNVNNCLDVWNAEEGSFKSPNINGHEGLIIIKDIEQYILIKLFNETKYKEADHAQAYIITRKEAIERAKACNNKKLLSEIEKTSINKSRQDYIKNLKKSKDHKTDEVPTFKNDEAIKRYIKSVLDEHLESEINNEEIAKNVNDDLIKENAKLNKMMKNYENILEDNTKSLQMFLSIMKNLGLTRPVTDEDITNLRAEIDKYFKSKEKPKLDTERDLRDVIDKLGN